MVKSPLTNVLLGCCTAGVSAQAPIPRFGPFVAVIYLFCAISPASMASAVRFDQVPVLGIRGFRYPQGVWQT